jgi:hypothetical protein
MANIKNWGEFLKDVPTDALLSEIEMRKIKQSSSVSESANDIMSQIDNSIERFGSYSFDDKGPWEVMDINSIKKNLSTKSIKEIGAILSEILDNYSNYERARSVVGCILGEFDSLPESEFDELLDLDDRFEY